MKKQFGFGTAVNMHYITDGHTKYQKFLYDNFEWAVPENAMKWRQMEYSKVRWLSIVYKGISIH